MKKAHKTLFILILFTGLLIHGTASAQNQGLQVHDLKAEYFDNPVGIDDPNPRLAWKLNSDQRNTMQTAYRVQVSTDADFTKSEMTWDTGKVDSDQSIHLHYAGDELESRERYYWRVQVWDNHGQQSGWSETSFWEMGLLNNGDWQAEWIEPGFMQDSTQSEPSPLLRREFDLDGEIQSARAYVTSHGLYEMKLNGQKVGDQVFAPGWTSYNKRLQYQTYDVTGLLQSGDNAVAATLGDGWYRGYLAWGDARNHYGTTLGLLAQIEVTYTDGSTEILGTDGNWKSTTGPIRKSDIYNGETYDARMEKQGWTKTGYDDRNWSDVKVTNHSKEILVAPEAPPVRKIQELKPVDIFTTPEGDTVADIGQNMVGWVRLNVEGPTGTEVTLKHAEVLDKDGNFYTANLRAADQKITYTLKGGGEEVYEPNFTFMGFRYVKVEGYPGELTADDLTGVVIHSDMEPTGHFATSNPLINQLQHNIVWGQKGNFLDIPTDCPQRDERLGWTGDIQVFAETASYNMHSAGFLTKWLRDLAADQLDNGSVPYVIPNVLGSNAAGASGWADASVIVPWTLYQSYGDEDILRTQYESMKGWVEYMRDRAQMDSTTYLWDNNFTFGDWLSFSSTASDYPGAYTDKKLISTAYFARSTDLLQRSAEILGNTKDAEEYAALLENIKKAFQNEYLTSSGRIMSNTQTAYLLALQFDLLPDNTEDSAIQYLVSRINERNHLTTGFLGTPHLNPILSDYGYNEEAFELLFRKEYPSWLYPVTKGATTIWERWDGIKPDSTFQDEGMNSFNHYAYGAIGEWLYKNVAGIEAAAPGYKQIAIHPTLDSTLTYARSIQKSPYGKIESEWSFSDNQFLLDVLIPGNTTATVTLPHAAGKMITENNQPVDQSSGIKSVEESGDDVVVEIGSGHYTFSYEIDSMTSPMVTEAGGLDINSTLAELIANKSTRNILEEYIPELMDSPWMSQVIGYKLERAMYSLPSKQRITQSQLDVITGALQGI